jgi:hypothetical protein
VESIYLKGSTDKKLFLYLLYLHVGAAKRRPYMYPKDTFLSVEPILKLLKMLRAGF